MVTGRSQKVSIPVILSCTLSKESYLNHSISGIGIAFAWHEMVTSSPSSTRTSFSVAMKDGGSPSTVRRVVLLVV